jgi:hypothetical protein
MLSVVVVVVGVRFFVLGELALYEIVVCHSVGSDLHSVLKYVRLSLLYILARGTVFAVTLCA